MKNLPNTQELQAFETLIRSFDFMLCIDLEATCCTGPRCQATCPPVSALLSPPPNWIRNVDQCCFSVISWATCWSDKVLTRPTGSRLVAGQHEPFPRPLALFVRHQHTQHCQQLTKQKRSSHLDLKAAARFRPGLRIRLSDSFPANTD